MNTDLPHTPARRISCLDFLKGVSVLWVVLMHVHYEYDKGCMPSWITLPYYMPIFCFVSGIFFRENPWYSLIAAKSRTLLLPFVTFYLFTLLLYKLHELPLALHQEHGILSIVNRLFGAQSVYSYQILNGALWFFIGLFCITLLYAALQKLLPPFLTVGVSLACSLAGLFLWARPEYNPVSPLFPLSHILYFLIYFALGALYGKKLLQLVDNGRGKWLLLLCIVPVALINTGYELLPWMHRLPYMAWQMLCSVCFIAFSVLCAKYLDRIKLLYPLRFYGENSLIVFATHMPLFALYYHAWFKTDIVGKLGFFALFLGVEYLLILFFNRCCPRLIGKLPR